jgi:EAL domain-containing protein (putative c-di-GMP-specific phosphodiesterase class I)
MIVGAEALENGVCETCVSNARAGSFHYFPIRIAVNLSAHQFKQQKLAERIATILHEPGLTPRLLEIEITETLLMQSTPETMRRIGDLKSLGIHISIDDFGTG